MINQSKVHYFSADRKEMLDFIPKQARNILEIGCGQGNFGQLVKKNGNVDYWAIELNPEMAQIASKKLDHVLSGNFLEKFKELPKKHYDCIVMNDVLEHFIEPGEVLKCCKILLSKKGVIVLSVPNVRFISNLFRLIFFKDWKYVGSGILDSTHYRFFTKKSFKRLLKESGFQILKLKGINRCIWGIGSFFINILTLYYFSDTLYLQYACVAIPESNFE